jgi:large subunit ribosomal protein L25
MEQQIELKAKKRTVLGKKVKKLRAEGIVPIVLYGREVGSIPLQVERRELSRVLAQAGTNRLIALKIGRKRKPHMALAREIQLDVVTHDIRHIDFYQVVMTEKVKAEVGLTFIGESPLVAKGEGILVAAMDTVEIECLPGDLIHSIEVNLSDLLEVGDTIQAKDLRVPPNVEIATDGEEVVAQVLPVRVMAELEVAAEEEVEAEVVAEGEEEAAEEAEESGPEP